jgi:hypothetical protein
MNYIQEKRLEEARQQLLQASNVEKNERDYQEEEFIKNIREGKISPLAVCNLPKDYFQYNRSCHDLLESQFPELFGSIKNKGGLWYTKRFPELGLINYYHLPLN